MTSLTKLAESASAELDIVPAQGLRGFWRMVGIENGPRKIWRTDGSGWSQFAWFLVNLPVLP